jgi:Uma2 family endonuclease
VLHRVNWDQYLAMSDALIDRHNPRMIYLDGSLTLLVTSRRHDWFAERLGQLVVAVAHASGILWEDSGQATYRREEVNAGVEGDKTFYFGEHARLMRGPQNIDLARQPPPDLTIEVELTHPADVAVTIWGRLGVPEIWRFDAEEMRVTFWRREDDGTYTVTDPSRVLPRLTSQAVLEQVRLADSLGSADWYAQLEQWARERFRQQPPPEG